MKVVSCKVIEDLIPLYIEELLSKDSKTLVESHLTECEDCRAYLEEFKEMEVLPIETDIRPLEKIQRSIQKKKWYAIGLSILLTLLIATLSVIYLTAPEYILYSEDVVRIEKTETGLTIVEFNEEVAGYDLERRESNSGDESVFHLTTWKTKWSEWTDSDKVAPIVLNSSGDVVRAVYYYEPSGANDRLIFGVNEYPNGGIMTLPRLSLNYLSIGALVLLVIGLGVLWLVRSKTLYFDRILKMTLLPATYLIAQFVVTGWSATTYSAIRDFSAILLVGILIYGVCWTGIEWRKNRVNE